MLRQTLIFQPQQEFSFPFRLARPDSHARREELSGIKNAGNRKLNMRRSFGVSETFSHLQTGSDNVGLHCPHTQKRRLQKRKRTRVNGAWALETCHRESTTHLLTTEYYCHRAKVIQAEYGCRNKIQR